MKICISCVLALLLVAEAVHGVTLVELQQQALNKRKVVDRYQANLSISEEDETIARSGYYPAVDLSYTVNRLDEDGLFESRDNSVAYAALSWNLFAGFRDKYNIQSAEFFRSSESYKLRSIEQDIQRNVALRYLSIFDRKANLQVAEDLHNTLRKTYEDAEIRFKVGLIQKNDLLKVRVDLDFAEIVLKRAEADLGKSVQLLAREIEDEVQLDQLTFAEFDQLPVLEDQQQYEQAMLENRSEIRVLQELAQALDAQVKAERARYAPSVDFIGSYRKYDDDFISGLGNNYDEEVRGQVVLSINIFDGFAKSSQVSKAKLEAQGVRYDLAELENDLKTELKNLFLDFKVSSDNAAVVLANISQAEENLRVTRLSYQEGLATGTDLLDAIASLSRAHFTFVTATREVFANYYNITRAVEGF
jgi:outer membrane protein TolC